MQRKFLRNLLFLLFLNLLIKPFWILGIDRSVQNVIGTQDYGFYFAILNFSFLFNIILDLGITNFNNRNIAQNNQLLNKHLSSILILKLMLALLYVIVTVTLGFIVKYSAEQIKLLVILGFNQFLISFVLYLRSNLSGLHLFKIDSFLSVLDRTLMIIICAVLLWGNVTSEPFKLEWYVYSQTAAYIITAFIAFVIVSKKAKFTKLNWNFAFFLLILRQSFPFAILALLMTFYNRIDTVMLERLLPTGVGDIQSGIYASAYRLLDASNMIAFLFAGLLLPIFAKMIKHKESVEQMTKLSYTLLITIAIIVAVGSVLFSKQLMEVLYPTHVEESVASFSERMAQSKIIFSLLMSCFVAISTTYIFGSLLTANGNLKALNLIAAGGMLINIVLNFILIPYFMAMGSAAVSLFTQFATAIAQVIYAQHKFKFKANYRFILTLLLFAILISGLGLFSSSLPFYWTYNFVLFSFASVIIAWTLRLLNIKDLLKILKKE